MNINAGNHGESEVHILAKIGSIPIPSINNGSAFLNEKTGRAPRMGAM